MRSQHTIHTLTLFLLLSLGVAAQAFYDASFDAGPDGFTPVGLAFDADGAARNFAGWGLRSRIRSQSRGGAMTFQGPGGLAALRSSQIDLPTGQGGELYLSFHQYLNTLGGQIRVLVTNELGGVTDTTLVLNLAVGGETSSGSYHLLDLSDDMAGATVVAISIELTGGEANFWIIDDIQLSRTLPGPVSFPRYFGEALTEFGIPFVVDSAGAPAVPYQLVADFAAGTGEVVRAALRSSLGAIVVRSCVCDKLEVWELPGGVFFDPVTGMPLGDPSDILTKTLPGTATSTVDGLDLNYYNYNELKNLPPGPALPLTAAILAGFSPAPTDAVRIAVLDTGLDLDHPDLAGYLFRDADTLGDGNDDDGDCQIDNPLGWNFVDNNNNPNDDNGHGTHVSGIVARNLNLCGECTIQLIPYKTHDSHGVGTMFATACATLQAIEDEVDVINDSWGFYGGGTDNVLSKAIEAATANGIIVIAAAGNDTLFLDVDPQYPALYDNAGIIAVGAHDTLPEGTRPLAGFSNFSDQFVDLAAFGVDVDSSLPGAVTGTKSGTSMSAPAVAATAALYGCDQGGSAAGYRTFLLSNAYQDGPLSPFIVNGFALNAGVFCDEAPTGEAEGLIANFRVCYRPDFEDVDIKPLQNLGPTTVRLFQGSGGLVTTATYAVLPAGESVFLSIAEAAPGAYLLVLETGGRTFTQGLVKR
jgi:hypothetical protein